MREFFRMMHFTEENSKFPVSIIDMIQGVIYSALFFGFIKKKRKLSALRNQARDTYYQHSNFVMQMNEIEDIEHRLIYAMCGK